MATIVNAGLSIESDIVVSSSFLTQQIVIPKGPITVNYPGGVAGKLLYNTLDNSIYYSDGLAWIQLSTGGGGLTTEYSHIAFVDSNGSDITGTVERFDLPFATLQAAITAANTARGGNTSEIWTVMIMPNGVSVGKATLLANINIKGFGKNSYIEDVTLDSTGTVTIESVHISTSDTACVNVNNATGTIELQGCYITKTTDAFINTCVVVQDGFLKMHNCTIDHTITGLTNTTNACISGTNATAGNFDLQNNISTLTNDGTGNIFRWLFIDSNVDVSINSVNNNTKFVGQTASGSNTYTYIYTDGNISTGTPLISQEDNIILDTVGNTFYLCDSTIFPQYRIRVLNTSIDVNFFNTVFLSRNLYQAVMTGVAINGDFQGPPSALFATSIGNWSIMINGINYTRQSNFRAVEINPQVNASIDYNFGQSTSTTIYTNAVQITLPAVSTMPFVEMRLKNITGGNINIIPDGTEQIDNAGAGVPYLFTNGSGITLINDGVGWFII